MAPRQTPARTEHRRLLRSAGLVGGITLVSRISGYLRDVVLALLLGTRVEADAWVAAFRLPNTLRRLVGEGNVSAAFVPVFADVAAGQRPGQTRQLADNFHAVLLVAAAALTLLGIAAAPWLVRWVLVPGFAGAEGAWELTTLLARMTFPYLVFISMAAALAAVLNAHDRFAAVAFTPVWFNLAMIALALALAGRWLAPAVAVAVGAVVGGVLQWASLIPSAYRVGMRFRPRGLLADAGLRRVGRLMLPGIFGVGITQINVLVGQALASYLQEGSVSSLYYAGRLNELALGVFVISVATVVLPLMSRQAAAGDRRGLVETLNFALRQVAFITLPAAVGLIVLRGDLVAVLLERGAFGPGSVALTAAALWGYGVGLAGYGAVRILAPGFYALRDTRTPVKAAAAAMVVNVAGCLALMGPLGHAGIALANSLAGYLNSALLLALLRRRVGPLGGRRLALSLVRLAMAAAAMGWVVGAVAGWWHPGAQPGLWRQALALGGAVLVGVVTYGAAAAALGAPELGELWGAVTGKPPALEVPAGTAAPPGPGGPGGGP